MGTPTTAQNPTLSLCMIVRDAERSLAPALASARPFVDEIVVVDTGSRDGTRDVAREFSARLFEFAWCDDFSAARNHSLEQATGDWILWLDADHTFPNETLLRLLGHGKDVVACNYARRAGATEPVAQRDGRHPGHVSVPLLRREGSPARSD